MPKPRKASTNDPIHSDRYRRERKRYRDKCEKFRVPCHLCGQPIRWDVPAGDPDAFELDHFFPRSTHPELAMDPANWRPSHCSCNRSRGNDDVRPLLGTPSEAW